MATGADSQYSIPIEMLNQKLEELEQKFENKLQEQEQHFQDKLKERDLYIDKLEETYTRQINHLNVHTGLLPYYMIFRLNTSDHVDSINMYTHAGGYAFFVRLYPQNGRLAVYSLKGDNDDQLKVPVKFALTVQLMNQSPDVLHKSEDLFAYIGVNIRSFMNRGDHTKEIQCHVTKENFGKGGAGVIAYEDFLPEAAYSEKVIVDGYQRIQFLRKNMLRMRIWNVSF